ncbi:uncharacterized protein LOC8051902 isoform X3 [Ixodes scapularis]|uniref:uncharacterized protein LOC8051902 isoform X3 n=1 Tax=Ixodes scapularis TaxID=6945 RepID=UPI00116188C2|nr:uncharacterized protein LOC8051902 isoform X3 [Ixodes scapularis]
MPDTSRTSVIKEIDKNQAAVHEYLFQLDQIETKLRRTNLSDEQRVALEDEVRTVKKQLDSLGVAWHVWWFLLIPQKMS